MGRVVNRDPATKDRLKVVFLPNFNVTNGQQIYAATEVSEQNTARSGKFSSDRTMGEYCRDIWKVAPVPVDVPEVDSFRLV